MKRRSHELLLLFALFACRSETDPSQREDAVTVARFEPLGTVDTTRPIQITFSKPLAPKDALERGVEERDLVTITPRLPFTARWLTADVLELLPKEKLEQSTRYRVSVRPEIAGSKLTLLGTTEFELNTKMFSLVSVEPFFETKDQLLVRANLEFNYPVRPSDVRGAITFLDRDKKVIGSRLTSQENGPVMAFELDPLPLSTEERKIDVRVDGSLGAIGGGEPLGKEVIRTITLGKPEKLDVYDVSAVQDGEKYQAHVRLSTGVTPENAAKYVTVSPELEYRLVELYHGIAIAGAFEPGKTYEITIKKGLTATNGALLDRDLTRQLTTPDLEPALRFSSPGNYLPRNGSRNIAVETINIKKLGVRVSKVFENNLAHILPRLQSASPQGCYEEEGCEEYYGGELGTFGRTLISDATLEVTGKKNTLVTSAISFDEIDVENRRGLYRLEVFDRDRAWVQLEKWMVATDLGIIAKIGPGYARAQIVSLDTSRPLGDVEVAFISRTNEVLGTATTDGGGVAQLKGNFERPGEPLTLIVARRGRDFSYLVLQGSAVSTHELDTGGAGSDGAPYRAYLWSDRGIYRPGDKAQLTALIREPSLRTPPSMPIQLDVRDPVWRSFARLRGFTGDQGAYTVSLEIPADAPTGRYSLRLMISGEVVIGEHTIMVEDFMPDRLKVDAVAKNRAVELGSPAEFTVGANYLFGPKAAGLRVEATCRFEETNIPVDGFSGFQLTDEETRQGWVSTSEDLGEANLDEEGNAALSCALAEGTTPGGPVRATLLATVSEEGGRAVTGAGSAMIHPHAIYVGLRRNAQGEYVEEKQDAALEAIAVDRDGKPKAGVALKVSIAKIEWHSLLKLVNNRYQYVSESSEKPVSELTITTERGPTAIPLVPAEPGELKITVEHEDGARAAIRFWVSGSGSSPWSMKYPDRISMTLDKSEYRPGETAQVMVRAPFEGKLFLTVERDQVLWSGEFVLNENTATVPIPIYDVMSPNAFVVAELIRSPDSRERAAPPRAFGVLPLNVDAERHRLAVRIVADEEMRPNSPLRLRIKVDGAEKRAFLMVAAVDEGILQVTGFGSPDPFAYFTQRRRLSLRTHDFFAALLPEEKIPASSLSVGSGGDAEVRRRHLNPISVKRVKPVALWSGLVPVGPDGWGVLSLDVPEFNGSLRVMAVAFADDRFGAASKNVSVRDPLVLTPTIPRFVAPLDKFVMPVEVYNGTGRAGSITVKTAIDGRIKALGAAEQAVQLEAGARKVIEWELEADEVIGRAAITVSAAGNGASTKATTELPIRPASTTITEAKTAVVKFGENVVMNLPSGFIPSSIRARVKIGPTPTAQLGAALDYLLEYPHGCLEQTVSRAFPLLYVRDLARREGVELSKDTLVDYYVNGAIDQVIRMLRPDGGLSFWPGGSWGYPWTTAYAIHFLVEARQAGFTVDQETLDRLFEHLERLAAGVTLAGYSAAPDFRSQVYALYVLALGGKPPAGALQYAADRLSKSADPATPEGLRVPGDEEIRALLGGALALGGMRGKANEIFALDFAPAPVKPRQDFWSPVRQDAVALFVLAELAPSHRSVPQLMESVAGRAREGRWSNTQENAFGLVALGKANKKLGGGREYWGTFTAGDEVVKKFNSVIVSTVESTGPEWIGKELGFSVTGAGSAFVGMSVQGIKAGVLPPKSEGIEVSRRFLDSTGAAIDPANIRQGDLAVVEVSVKAGFPSGTLENVAVVDLLPAGLEIENPRLTNAGSSLAWITDRSDPQHLDVRDDRIIFYGTLWGGRVSKYYYVSRAVTRGSFTLPHVFAEAMYDPAFQGYAGAGKVIVSARGGE